MEALSAAYEQAEPNRIVSVAAWPLRRLSKVSLQEAEVATIRLKATIETEPHGLRKLDGLSAILHAVMDSAELRVRILPAFREAASLSVGWRTERIVAFAAEALAEFDILTWVVVYSYFRKWNAKPSEEELSLLERALKKCSWRGPRQPWTQREDDVLHR